VPAASPPLSKPRDSTFTATPRFTREIYELDAVVQPGNSGGPLVASGDTAEEIPDGTVVGVVFARSTTETDVGYALALPAVNQDIAKAESSDSTVTTGACAAD